jgi:hypothetical protein
MTTPHSTHSDYSRYFTLKQRVYLIKTPETGDGENFESLGGAVVSCKGNSIALQIPYTIGQAAAAGADTATYKLTSEAMGNGIQIMATLVSVSEHNIFHLKLHGNLEMYQRRLTPRVDTILNIFQIRRDASLAVYRKEFKRIMDGIHAKNSRPNIKLLAIPINLSVGGMRIDVEALEPVFPLSMFFLELGARQPLVCAVAELVWFRLEQDNHVCGYRFVQIRKADQELINRFVLSHYKSQGQAAPASKINWDLVDRMSIEQSDSAV